jgi:hypothetical protein
MDKKPSLPKALLNGIVFGVIGAFFFMVPTAILRHILWYAFGESLERGGFLFNLVVGYPLNMNVFQVLSITGAVVGMLGAYIGYLRKSTRNHLWGLWAGAFINFFFGFWEAM